MEASQNPLFILSLSLFTTIISFHSYSMTRMFGSYYLLLCCLLVLLPCWTTADGFTGTVEVDLVFPRNGTYAPTELMPVVFAIQSPQTAMSLDILLRWQILQHTGDLNKPGVVLDSFGYLSSYKTAQSNNPFFEIDSIFNTTNIESNWVFSWSVTTTNCSSLSAFFSDPSSDAKILQGVKNITFTTKNGAPLPDLVGATDQSVCAADQSFNFDIADVMPTQIPTTSNFQGGNTSCAVTSSILPTVTPNPCAVTMDTFDATSISSKLTSSICALSPARTLVSCPPTPTNTKTGGAMGQYFSKSGVVWLFIYTAWVTYVVLS
jgi:hypothetical protein